MTVDNTPVILFSPPQTQYDHNCACPDLPFRLNPVHPGDHGRAGVRAAASAACASVPDHHCPTPISMPAPPIRTQTAPTFQRAPQIHTDHLAQDFHLAISTYSVNGPSVLNTAALNRMQTFKTPRPLEEATDFSLAKCGLLISADEPPTMAKGKPTTITAWLHVTNACNLACPYCYVRKSSARMSDETGIKVIDTIFNNAVMNGFQSVKLKFAGGEAALNFKLVEKLYAYAQSKAAKNQLTLEAIVLSNGTVWTPKMARRLADNGIKLMISIDGVGATHDAQRPTIGGNGSFARIEHNIDHVLRPNNVQPEISVTLTGKNANAAAEAVDWAIDRDLSFSLNFYRETDYTASHTDLKLEEAKIIRGMQQAYRVIQERMPTRPFLNGLLDRVQSQAHAHTCGVGQSYLVFTHAGKLAQCQMHLTDNAMSFNANDNVLKMVQHGDIPVISVEQKEGCKHCIWRYRCTGGCPIETYRATGRFDVKSPNCNIYKTLYPEALRLEGLRLMKLERLL